MSSHATDHQALDAARDKPRSIVVPLTVTPFLVAYFATSLIVDRALNAAKGQLIFIVAAVLVGSLILEWRGVRLTQAWRVATVVGCSCLGILLAFLVSA